MPARKPEVIVLGAGVIGLHTAISLLQAGYGVTIVAKFWPGDKSIEYCSPWAGAHWSPHSLPSETTRFRNSELATYNYWAELVKKVPREECGLTVLPGVTFLNSGTPETLWWWGLVPNMRALSESELVPGSTQGVVFDSFTIDVPIYLAYLLGKVGELNAKTITAEVDTLEEVFELPGINKDGLVGMVNCTGLGAKKLVPGETMYPIKGQTLLVKGCAKKISLMRNEGQMAYVLPRINLTLLGGSTDKDNWDPEPDPLLTEEILERCKSIAPEILNGKGEFEVLAVQCGRRPARDTGPRVELEERPGGRFICHNYGHGGAGFQTSYGSAVDVVGLINEHLNRT